jgi:hypothetical protein
MREFRKGNQYMKGVKKIEGWTTGKREKGRMEGDGWRGSVSAGKILKK